MKISVNNLSNDLPRKSTISVREFKNRCKECDRDMNFMVMLTEFQAERIKENPLPLHSQCPFSIYSPD